MIAVVLPKVVAPFSINFLHCHLALSSQLMLPHEIGIWGWVGDRVVVVVKTEIKYKQRFPRLCPIPGKPEKRYYCNCLDLLNFYKF
jgi:hypothetical protein